MFSVDQAGALRTLVRLWSLDRFVLIGASAMSWHLGAKSRETHDLDLVVAMPLESCHADLESEPGWSRHPKREQTWLAPGHVLVDLIPFGGNQGGAAILKWPRSGFEMSLVGFRLALDHSVKVDPLPGLSVRVAALEVLCLLKMVAFLDRPYERDRDLGDIALLLDSYVGDEDDRRFADEVFDLALRYDEVSPFLLGWRLAEIVDRAERDAVMRFVGLASGTVDSTATQARMLVVAPPSWRRDPDELLLRMAAFERGFTAHARHP